jgi:hypothetical protein
LKDEALFILCGSADDCISAVAFNAVFAELICFVEVMGSHTNNTKVLHETFVVKVTGSRANNAKVLHETFSVEVTDSNPVGNLDCLIARHSALQIERGKGTNDWVIKSLDD